MRRIHSLYFAFWDKMIDITAAFNWRLLSVFAIFMGGGQEGWCIRHFDSNDYPTTLFSYNPKWLIVAAAKSGNLAIVQKCLENEELFDIDPDDYLIYIRIAFGEAALYGQSVIVDEFLNNDQCFTELTKWGGSSALCSVAESGHIAMLDKLLAKNRTSCYMSVSSLYRAVFYAAERKHLGFVRYLLEIRFKTPAPEGKHIPFVDGALNYVAKEKNPQAIRTILNLLVEEITNTYKENIKKAEALKELGLCSDLSELIDSFVDDIPELEEQLEYNISYLFDCNNDIESILLPYWNWCQSIKQVYSKGWSTEYVKTIFSNSAFLQLMKDETSFNDVLSSYALKLAAIVYLASLTADVFFIAHLINRFTEREVIVAKFLYSASPLVLTGCAVVLIPLTIISGAAASHMFFDRQFNGEEQLSTALS
jgi:hypothetical protein